MQFSSICPQVDSRILPLARGCFSAEVLGSLYDGLPWWGSDGQESACGVGELGLIPGLGRSPGKRNGNPLQYSCLEIPMDRGVWQATVLGWEGPLEKGVATHSSILAWRTPWTEQSGGLQSIGSQRVGLSDLTF